MAVLIISHVWRALGLMDNVKKMPCKVRMSSKPSRPPIPYRFELQLHNLLNVMAQVSLLLRGRAKVFRWRMSRHDFLTCERSSNLLFLLELFLLFSLQTLPIEVLLSQPRVSSNLSEKKGQQVARTLS